ncbi:MAG: T9SS type A sorting domain-containing protein [Bacteroidia bacterium]
MRYSLGIVILVTLGFQIAPQEKAKSLASFPWEFVGPSNYGGAASCGLKVGNKIYVGSRIGGLWVSEDNGNTWRPDRNFNANLPGETKYTSLAVSCLASEGNTIYIGTGDLYFNNLSGVSVQNLHTTKGGIYEYIGRPGAGIFVSTDGGQTFSNQNATWPYPYPTISYDVSNPFISVLDIGVRGNRAIAGLIRGVSTTSDNWATTSVPTSAPSSLLNSTVVSVAVTANRFWAATKDSLYFSTDEGNTFQTYPTTLIKGGSRLRIAVAPSNPQVLYVAGVNASGKLTGVWRSTDEGNTWETIAPPEDNLFVVADGDGRYSLALRVHPQNPDFILLGSRDNAYAWSPNQNWVKQGVSATSDLLTTLPPFIHDFIFLDNGEYLVVGDGKIVKITENGTRRVGSSQGFSPVGILSFDISPRGDIVASGPRFVNLSRQIPNTPFFSIVTSTFPSAGTALGNVVHITSEPDLWLFGYRDGRVRRSENNAETFGSFYFAPEDDAFYSDPIQSSKAASDGDRPEEFGPLFPPILYYEKFDNDTLKKADRSYPNPAYAFAFTSRHVYLITRPRNVNPGNPPRWNRITSKPLSSAGSITYSNYLQSSRTIATAAAMGSDYTLYIGTSNGKLFRIRNAHQHDNNRPTTGDTLQEITPTEIAGRWIASLAVHPNDPNLLAIGLAGYYQDNTNPQRIYLTQNATDPTPTFTPIQNNLPEVPVYALYFHPDSSALLLAGTEWGLWRSTNVRNSTPWEELTGEIGRIPVFTIRHKRFYIVTDTLSYDPILDIAQVQLRAVKDPESPIYIGTFGAGIWKLGSRFVTTLPTTPSLTTPFHMSLYPNPTSQNATLQIQCPSALRNLHIEIYTLTGAKVWNAHYASISPGTQELPLPPLSTGTYLVQASAILPQGPRRQTLKLISLP